MPPSVAAATLRTDQWGGGAPGRAIPALHTPLGWRSNRTLPHGPTPLQALTTTSTSPHHIRIMSAEKPTMTTTTTTGTTEAKPMGERMSDTMAAAGETTAAAAGGCEGEEVICVL